jgi:hypothetical protein
MNHRQTANTTRLKPDEVLGHYYLEIRCKLLEIAAIHDRFQRAGGGDPAGSADPRLVRCLQALRLLASPGDIPDRAERIALIFSDPD